MLDNCEPCGVEVVRRGRTTPARHAVRLLDERDADTLGECRSGRGHEVGCGHPAAGAVTEYETGPRHGGVLQVRVRTPVRRLDRERLHRARGRPGTGTAR